MKRGLVILLFFALFLIDISFVYAETCNYERPCTSGSLNNILDTQTFSLDCPTEDGCHFCSIDSKGNPSCEKKENCCNCYKTSDEIQKKIDEKCGKKEDINVDCSGSHYSYLIRRPLVIGGMVIQDPLQGMHYDYVPINEENYKKYDLLNDEKNICIL